jgi:hypothetical protein
MRYTTPKDGLCKEYEFMDQDNMAYAKSGHYWSHKHFDENDLIAEWAEPAEESEWSEWGSWGIGWSDGIGTQDYMYRRINGVEEYRKRKPRPVTMLVDVIDGTPDLSTLRPVTE